MFGTIRKHQTWLWAVIITVTIITFVIYFGPQTRVSNVQRGSENYGSISGEPITREAYGEAQREIYLRYFFMHNATWPDEEAKKRDFDPLRDTYYRLLFIRKQRDLNIHPNTDAMAQIAREMVRPLARAGINSPDEFVKRVLEPRGFTMDDFERFVRHELGIQELIFTVGLGGKLVTPQEAQDLYVREHQELSAEALFFAASNHLAEVTNVTPEAVTQFYTSRTNRYAVPERVLVSYVEFPASNWLAQAEEELVKTNLTEMVDANAQRMGTNLFKGAKTVEESKANIRRELIRVRAMTKARQRAVDFANLLLAMEPSKAENFGPLALTNGLTVKLTQPFDLEEGPKDLEAGPDFAKAAFALKPAEPFAGPIEAPDGWQVIAFDKKFPSEIPPLDRIRDQVTLDYKYNQAVILARVAGLEFYSKLTNSMAEGKTFDAVCADAKLTPVTLLPFSLSTPSLPDVEEVITLNQFKQLAFSTAPGKISNFQMTGEGGLILYVKAQLPLDPAKMKTDLPAFVARVRQVRQNEAFNQWFRKEAERGLRDTPLNRPQTPTLSPGSAKS
jgi:hypothetical protein